MPRTLWPRRRSESPSYSGIDPHGVLDTPGVHEVHRYPFWIIRKTVVMLFCTLLEPTKHDAERVVW